MAADCVALAGVGPGLENSAPLCHIAHILTHVVTSGGVTDERIVEGHKHDALSSLGVNHQLPEVFGDRDLVLNQVHLSVIDL